jgi:dTDP-4-amino-4,6-dideoxygalactose transaminase
MKYMNTKIWLSSPHMGGTELNYIHEAFDTNWVAPLGPNVNGFEHDLQKFTGSKHAAALTSGTAAIHLGLIILGVKAGDTVICQSFTFSASANPITYIGATPVFVDSESETWNMSPLYLRKAIETGIANGKKPKAIIPVHLYGMPANMPEIVEIANEFQIPIIEDAAEGLGSHIDGKFLGTFGEIGVLSFNGNKIITTSGGGALISDHEDHVNEARFLSTQARDNAPHYQHSKIGFNYRMSNISAGIGRGQMEVLNDRINRRREVFQIYKNALKDIPAIQFLNEPNGYFSNRWLTTILVMDNDANITRETLRLALEKENIESRPLWKPMHLQPIFSNYEFFGDGTSERLFELGLCLPSGSNLTQNDLDRVITKIRTVFSK